MGRQPRGTGESKCRSIGIRLTAAQYAWFQTEAQRQTVRLGFPVTMSAIAHKILSKAIKEAGSAQG